MRGIFYLKKLDILFNLTMSRRGDDRDKRRDDIQREMAKELDSDAKRSSSSSSFVNTSSNSSGNNNDSKFDDSRTSVASSSSSGARKAQSREQKEIDEFGESYNNYGGSQGSPNRAESKDNNGGGGSGGSGGSSNSNSNSSGSSSIMSSIMSRFGVGGSASSSNMNVDYSDLKDYITRPRSDKDNFTQCYIDRDRSLFGAQSFRCYLEGSEKQTSQRMMTAKKDSTTKTCYYLISMDESGGDRASPNMLGKLRGLDLISSQYLITDNGISFDKSHTPSTYRKELGVIFMEYESNRPSSYKIYVPKVNNSHAHIWQPSCTENTILSKVSENKFDNLVKLVNKQPKWDAKIQAHVLNFQGRVKEASIKNFQLCIEGPDGVASDEVVLQFGRVDKDRFCMDVKYPLSIFQAFSICISMLDKGKIADRKGYELLNRIPGMNNRDSAPVGASLSGSGSNSNSNSGGGGGGGGGDSKDDKESAQPSASSAAPIEVSGSMSGSTSIGGYIAKSLPSSDYVKNMFNRKI